MPGIAGGQENSIGGIQQGIAGETDVPAIAETPGEGADRKSVV